MKNTRPAGAFKITQKFVSTVKGTGRRERYCDTTVTGLSLRVSPDGASKVFYFDYLADGKRCLYRIDNAKRLKLELAKDEARKLAGYVASGGNPAKDRRAEREQSKRATERTLRKYLDNTHVPEHLSALRAGKSDEQRIRCVYAELLDTDLQAITPAKLKKLYAKCLSDGLTQSTVARDRAILNVLFERAITDGVMDANPLDKLPSIKVKGDKRTRFLGQYDDDPKERQRFLKALEKQPSYFRVMVLLALNSGMRRGEIFALTWKHVSLRTGIITVHATSAKANRTRRIPMSPTVLELLKEWKKTQTVTDLQQHVFLNPVTGKPFTDVKLRWRKLIQAAKVRDFRFHDCRHDFASRLVQRGVDLYTVKELLGHASISMTERYAHLKPDVLSAAVAVLG